MARRNFYLRYVKPVGDWCLSLILLLILLPFITIITIILLLHYRSSPLFIQERVGRNESVFKLIKFKTMRVRDQEESTTGLSKLIRSYSIDELPQLLNVLIGNMSLIGPRPLLVEYLPHYNEEERKRHWLKPGITGWAQVNGRNSIDWGERMKLDVYYVNHASFLLDCRILMKSIVEVFKRDRTVYKDDKTIKFSDYAAER
ncbi:sugar transferase [Ekhidna sp.]|uniref:sugar transferase n=1 Tax=Ekhidna sp. TaxID=2608089 RepID=UPI003CCC0DDE